MSKTSRDKPAAEDRHVRGYVSVNPNGLVVSAGSGTRKEMAGEWQGTISLLHRESGLAVQLDHDAALKLAASLLRAGSFLREEKALAQGAQDGAAGAADSPRERHVKLVGPTDGPAKRSKLH